MPKHLFTTQNARHFAALGNQAIKTQKEALRDAVLIACANPELDFAAKRLIRVRLQLNIVDKELDDLIVDPDADPKRTKNLLEMQHRLNAQERELSMRPAPGTSKPASAKASRSSRMTSADPIIADPAPPSPTPANDPNAPNG